MTIRFLTRLALLATLVALPASAEHEVYFRYTVLGYVKDAAGRPQEGQIVELTRVKTGLTYRGRTDGTGLFVIVVRLGDESAGESLSLRHAATRLGLVARFDAANHADERGTRVDLVGARAVERPAAFRSTLATLLGASRP
jgi:hypothetical protein